MRNEGYFKDKRVVIVGLARSGLACANLLYGLGADVRVTDSQDNENTRSNSKKLVSPDIKVELGRHSREMIDGCDLLVISPGVTDESLPVIIARELNIPIISEIEVGFILCPATIIAVTGASGKTTVTTLIAKIIEAKGDKVFICGNIGNPFCSEVEKMKTGDFVSLEVSSFQLEKIYSFKPRIAVVLNISPNHLDRYRDMDEYIAAKKRIYLNQDKTDYLVLNAADSVLKSWAKEAPSRVVFFLEEEGLNPNQTAVLAVGTLLGINRELCLDVFKKFKGIEHRMEFVTQINNVKFVNDSKATTVDSAIWALRNTPEPVILIAGGKDKGVDYASLLPFAKGKIREIILIGEAKEKIRSVFDGALPVDDASSMQEAVEKAFYKASAGDCILLSPMCSSFDMFSNYEERGRVFKDAVNMLKNKRTIQK